MLLNLIRTLSILLSVMYIQTVLVCLAETEKTTALNFVWHVAERTSRALQDYARTGDVYCLLSVQRHLVAVQDDCGDK